MSTSMNINTDTASAVATSMSISMNTSTITVSAVATSTSMSMNISTDTASAVAMDMITHTRRTPALADVSTATA